MKNVLIQGLGRGTKLAEATAIREAALAQKRQCAVIQNMRYLPQVKKCRELVKDGLVGELSLIEMNFHRWRPPRGLDHAVLLNHGVHHIDLIRAIAPTELRHINAVEWDPKWAKASPGTGRFVRVTAITEDGWCAAYNASYAEAGRETPQTGELRIVGSKGTLEVSGEPDFNPQLRFHSVERATGEFADYRILVERRTWADIDRQIIEEFAQAIDTGTKAETDIEDNLNTLEWLFQAVECLEH